MASLLVLTITLMVIGSLLLASAYLKASLETIKDKVDITVSFQADASENDILSMKNTLAALPQVKEVGYISREQELADFKTRHQDNTIQIQSLQEIGNPFGARLNIKAKDPSQYESIARFLDISNGSDDINRASIDQITFKKDIVERLITVIRASQRVGFAASMLLVFVSILVTFNTISLAIYSAREEISVMRLVGAGNTYISGPFIVEGIMAGIISAFVSILLLYPLTVWIKAATVGVYGGIDLVAYYINNFAQIFLLLLLAGTGLGVIASLLAVRRYLKI